jgi:hypothetical protein
MEHFLDRAVAVAVVPQGIGTRSVPLTDGHHRFLLGSWDMTQFEAWGYLDVAAHVAGALGQAVCGGRERLQCICMWRPPPATRLAGIRTSANTATATPMTAAPKKPREKASAAPAGGGQRSGTAGDRGQDRKSEGGADLMSGHEGPRSHTGVRGGDPCHRGHRHGHEDHADARAHREQAGEQVGGVVGGAGGGGDECGGAGGDQESGGGDAARRHVASRRRAATVPTVMASANGRKGECRVEGGRMAWAITAYYSSRTTSVWVAPVTRRRRCETSNRQPGPIRGRKSALKQTTRRRKTSDPCSRDLTARGREVCIERGSGERPSGRLHDNPQVGHTCHDPG